ncbi:alpha-glucan family phosphorylase [Adhaeribacter rhizoryzae]|uniref:Alpha-glucan family phosphorylase n=1 Tax=Adhaeribacter rhizoryzae TaxID=2607907 RepID=A0A5M6DHV9_9BACT|nr:alpha-glucan family phosphorylase [Adhaeribacter rhizoryzae]KAA5544865.1 alpha-glucan family phosphorylase [Adhaeribacter rhizoryzae]
MSEYNKWYHPYGINPKYTERVAYFSMEFGIHQALKIYSGGLGYLAGSHMRSAYDLRQNMIGIGMLWKFGYYDQVRNDDQTMRAQFSDKYYTFLEDPGITVSIIIHGNTVWVKAFVLKPETFGTVPVYLLTTDIPENDYLSQTISHMLYDHDTAARIAQSMVLGLGGAKVVEALGGAARYHMNEAHALPLAFHLYEKNHNLEEVKERLVFTTHTPEKAGNEEHDIMLLNKMTFFNGLHLDEVRFITGMHDQMFSHTLAALRLARVANGVSQLHGEVAREMWSENEGICEIKAITNAQNVPFWRDDALYSAFEQNNDEALVQRKSEMKKPLFEVVADQTGKLFRTDVLTIVWARRFAAYKRADLLLRDLHHFFNLINREGQPVQVIWAGKPYPFDQGAIEVFNKLVKLSYKINNFAVLTGYEIELSRKLKHGADIWLNTPRRPREASGTSGMTAAMNGAINFTVQDGWIPEFGRHGENSFLFPIVDTSLPDYEQDEQDYTNMMRILEEEIIPAYYQDRKKWVKIMKQSMQDVTPMFGADRMADEYYKQLYQE